MCFWGQTNTRDFSSPRCIRLIVLLPQWERNMCNVISIVNLYDSAVSCLASTLPNHDGHLAGLGTTSPPAGNKVYSNPSSTFSFCQIIFWFGPWCVQNKHRYIVLIFILEISQNKSQFVSSIKNDLSAFAFLRRSLCQQRTRTGHWPISSSTSTRAGWGGTSRWTSSPLSPTWWPMLSSTTALRGTGQSWD